MSTLPDNEFDLEKLFLPAWAQEPSSAKYAHFEGEAEKPDRHGDRRGPRPPRREGPPGPRRDDHRPRGEARGGPPRFEGGRGRAAAGERPPFRRPEPRERPEPPPPLPDINLSLVPEEKGVESLARQIKVTGRAYPLFDIAHMILQKPDRHAVHFTVKKNAEGQPVQPLFVCALDDTLWLSQDEAVAHVLKKHFATFYQAERTATEPPKGKYTFVAQCGLSGAILGPPNYHDYQNQLRKLHTERFSRMPFETFKSRVRIVRDEEVVKKWIDDQSWRTQYICLNLPEPLRLATMEEVEKHFRETHKENIIKATESHSLNGLAARGLRCPELVRLVRQVWEDQRRFPLQIATVLSQQFAARGLQFFKVNKAITHVCVARPHYLDLAAAPVSEGVKNIVEFIDAHPRATRRELVEALAPSPAPPSVVTLPVEGQPPPPLDTAAPTPEQTAVVGDLHWLIHQGHVIEFANGILETAKKPVPKPPRPEPKPGDKPAPAEPSTTPAPAADTVGEGSADVLIRPANPAGPPPAAYTTGETATPAPVLEPLGEATAVPVGDPPAGAATPQPGQPAARLGLEPVPTQLPPAAEAQAPVTGLTAPTAPPPEGAAVDAAAPVSQPEPTPATNPPAPEPPGPPADIRP